MNKPPESHLPSSHAGRGENLDPWNEFLSESSDDLERLRDPSDEFASELVAGAPPRDDRSLASDGFDTARSVAPIDERVLPGSSDSVGESGDSRSLVDDVVRQVDGGGSLQPIASRSEIEQAISLADVVSRQVSVHWPEAVATVQALCASLVADGSAGAPELKEVLITPAGLVLPRDDSWSERDVRNVGLALHALLSNSTPPLPLRLFVTSSMSSQRYSSIELYAEALSLYEVPSSDRAELVRALYRRSLDVASTGQVERDRSDPEPRSRWMVPLATAAVAAVVTAGAGVALWLWQTSGQVTAQPNEEVGSAAVTVEANTAPALPPPAPPPPAPPPAPRDTWKPGPILSSARQGTEGDPSFLPARTPVQLRVSSPSPSSADVGSAGAEIPSGSAPPPDTRPPSQETARPIALAAPGLSRDPTIYSSADTDVQPPQMLPPLMAPTPPGSTVDRVSNTLELIIDEHGEVESVRYLNTPKRLIDATLLSPVKNLKFKPAQKGGFAVKYRLRLTVKSSQT